MLWMPMRTPGSAHCPSCSRGPAGDTPDSWSETARGESPLQRLDRVYAELLQEVRVMQTGIQILLAFLLWLAFTPEFGTMSTLQRDLYVLALVAAVSSVALLMAPACCHRFTYRQRLKGITVRVANRCAMGGIALLFTALTSAVLLVLDMILSFGAASIIGAATVLWFATWWFITPLVIRTRHRVPALAAGAPAGTSAMTPISPLGGDDALFATRSADTACAARHQM